MVFPETTQQEMLATSSPSMTTLILGVLAAGLFFGGIGCLVTFKHVRETRRSQLNGFRNQ